MFGLGGSKDETKPEQDEPQPISLGEAKVHRAAAGETHQLASDVDGPPMTTEFGVAVSDNQNSLKIGPRGPIMMEDFALREKIFNFDHERIPERVVHARGYGVKGYFETYESLSEITKADLFQRAGEKTDVFVRFSTVLGSKGAMDLPRDVRGFATKFYTREGNWDLVGNNMPVFFIQDPIKFPDLIHAAKEEADRGFPQGQTAHDTFWDFISLTPESMHIIMWAMSDRGIPRSFRFIEGFGVHTFKFVNAEGKVSLVKFHWKPLLGVQSVVWNEVAKINGADCDFHRRDMWEAIESGNYPEWELALQVFDEEFAERFDFDVLDPTKIIPEEQVPLRRVGKMVLDRLVDNFFAETEQVAFCTQNVVPGVDFTDDPLLQGRNFSYLDTQLKRLGSPNFNQLPVNAPICPVNNLNQDGHMVFHNVKGRTTYEPSSLDGPIKAPREDRDAGFRTHPQSVSGQKTRLRSESFADHYSQARQFYISQTRVEKQHIIDALIFELSKVKAPTVRVRMVGHLRNIDEGLASGVTQGLGLPELPEPAKAARPTRMDLKPSPGLSIIRNHPGTFRGRKLGILTTNNADATVIGALKSLFEVEGALVQFVTPQIEGVTVSDGTFYPGNENFEGGFSVLFDAVAVVISEERAVDLSINPLVRQFILDAFMHAKFIGYNDAATPLFKNAGVGGDVGVKLLEGSEDCMEFLGMAKKTLRFWERGKVYPETA